MKIHIFFIILLLFAKSVLAGDSIVKRDYYYFPKNPKPWNCSFLVGLGIAKLPMEVVDDEINTSPTINSGFRLDLPENFTLRFDLNFNYIANLGSLDLQWCILNKKLTFGIGTKTSLWFGHLEFEAIHLKSFGVIVNPFLVAGIDFKKFLFTGMAETQYSYMNTSSEDILLGVFYKPHSGYGLRLAIEQPLWNNHWVVLGVKLNYSKFYYQSWLSYSTIDEYLFYPEVLFGFLL